MSQIKKSLIVSALIVLMVGVVSCSANAPAASPAGATDSMPVVTDEGVFHAEGKVVPQQYSTLSFQTGGEIGEIYVKEGQSTHKGEILASLTKTENLLSTIATAEKGVVDTQKNLDDLFQAANLERDTALKAWHDAQTEMIEARQELNEVDTKEYADKLDDLEEDVQEAEEDLDDAQEDLDKYLNLDPTSDKRKDAQEDYDEEEEQYLDTVYKRDLKINELDVAKANYDAAVAKVDDAKREYEQKQNGPDTEKLKQAQAALAEAKAQLVSAIAALDNSQILAPYDGIVVDLFHLSAGTFVNPGQSVVQVADFSNWFVETKDLTELDVVKVKVGDEVELVADALPDVVMKGTVTSIKQVFGEYSGDVVYTIRIQITDPAESLRWGMTVDTKFTQPEE